jgi:hypothetical protein
MFKMALGAARVLVPDDQIRVLSGKHGFVSLGTELYPYDQVIRAMRDTYNLTIFQLREQARQSGVADSDYVLSLCSTAYSGYISSVWPRAIIGLYGCSGIGQQRARLSSIMRMGERFGVSAGVAKVASDD